MVPSGLTINASWGCFKSSDRDLFTFQLWFYAYCSGLKVRV